MQLLLIEDNLSVSEVVHRSITALDSVTNNFTLVCAANALDGLRLARKQSFDGYLIDLDLPDISGLQVGLALHHMMQRAQLKPAWIVAVTAQSDSVTIQRARDLGFHGFLGKPFGTTDLAAMLTRLQSEALHIESVRDHEPAQ